MTTTLSGESEYRLLIGGEFQPGGDGTYDIVNPATEEVVGAAPEASVEQARAAAAAARGAFDGWSRTSPKERAALLQAAADALVEFWKQLTRVLFAVVPAVEIGRAHV